MFQTLGRNQPCVAIISHIPNVSTSVHLITHHHGKQAETTIKMKRTVKNETLFNTENAIIGKHMVFFAGKVEQRKG
eukprot:6328873-Amphidinium_carterae.1